MLEFFSQLSLVPREIDCGSRTEEEGKGGEKEGEGGSGEEGVCGGGGG